jgi:hypothetical protein
MNNVVDLQEYITGAQEQRGFGPWVKRFGESYDQNTRLPDISDRTLYMLALPGEERAVAYYELIMGVLDLGSATKFYYLDNPEQMKVMDIHLFLADQVRFEMMRRLGWLETYYCQNFSLLKMIHEFDVMKAAAKNNPPQLAPSDPDFDAYQKLLSGDREAFIRRKLRKALETFKQE